MILDPLNLLLGLPLGLVFGLWHFHSLRLVVHRLLGTGMAAGNGEAALFLPALLHLGRFLLLGLAVWLCLRWNAGLLPGACIGLLAARWLILRSARIQS
ncbi:hypothetical protein [Ferrovibrio sp.]|uniref:hypothetical protein n=1 Tax=Ferrovibrio sp. TaxID=1917215 RepID=UPI001B68E4E2|nr:hypothetical protein [Ferrovibrio sp.]MBP7063233.1 hypothetical protein [Ferrovibrio sp.]